jgi:serine/threonine protein kinase
MRDLSALEDQLKLSIERSFPEYFVSDPIGGTYGQVWILSRFEKKTGFKGSDGFAIKTVMLSDEDGTENDILETFEREMNLSLTLPSDFNVLPIFGFVDPKLSVLDTNANANAENKLVFVSGLKMKAMSGSLQDWVDDQNTVTIENRLIAMVQAGSGLRHLYHIGFEGHGDIKPSNFLYSDLRDSFPGIKDADDALWPSNQHPYRVVVADFGWADAWVDLGFSQKAWRQYLAPERLDNVFKPMKSDMFSLGIVLAEIVMGKHPASNYKKAVKSTGEWDRCIKNGNWDLSEIESDRLKNLILSCLNHTSFERPSIDLFIDELCLELEERYRVKEVQPFLAVIKEHFNSKANEHLSWASRQTVNLSRKEKDRTLLNLKAAIEDLNVSDYGSCAEWANLAIAFYDITESGDYIESLRKTARKHLTGILSGINCENIDSEVSDKGQEWVQKFELFSSTISLMVELAESSYEDELSKGKVSPFLLAALAFTCAGSFKDTDMTRTRYYLNEGIRHCPDQACLYYFDVLWGDMAETMRKADLMKDSQIDTVEVKKAKLENAILYAPDWNQPRKMLEQIKRASD